MELAQPIDLTPFRRFFEEGKFSFLEEEDGVWLGFASWEFDGETYVTMRGALTKELCMLRLEAEAVKLFVITPGLEARYASN